MGLDRINLIANGIYVEKATPRDRLNALAIKLWPVRTRFPLLRIGSEYDGGYLIPDDLEGIAACFSPGVDTNASFEKELHKREGIPSHLADYSVGGPPLGFAAESFSKKFLGAFDDDVYITLDSWVSEKTQSTKFQDLLLQMDIEGGEYATILRASDETLERFRIIIIEIHDIEAWAQPNFFSIVEIFFQKLLANFHVVHNHPNNCCGVVDIGGFLAPRVFELTFLRKDRAHSDGFCKLFPHPLDKPNLIERENLILPENWYYRCARIPDNDLDFFLNDVSGIIHVGANVGQERALYDDLNLSVIWIEPIPDVYEKLKSNIYRYRNQFAYNCLLTDLDDEEYDFKIANNDGASSSIFSMGSHKELWPEIGFSSSIKLKSKTLFSFVDINKLSLECYQALILDTQGSELLVLKGSGDLLNKFKYIKIEVADFESYIGCPKPEEVESYLAQFGFKEIRREVMIQKEGLGSYYDILYKK